MGFPSYEEHEEHKELTADENGKLRIGNSDWCLCGSCRAMETSSESLCCKDTNDIPHDHFEGSLKKRTKRKTTLLREKN